ncbi:hypothetical protein LHK_01880 [Laribacter hongkongensis HLHK9]|uniref:Uncharacterized protein n=1 Tax=Laribacter hongkongensis (strain HLHK9) TaxID=557598 RepID=C1D8S4_LARHH|nr:hypothetical protein LHK_01880 [Laribacter hongkongensis HLHK9]
MHDEDLPQYSYIRPCTVLHVLLMESPELMVNGEDFFTRTGLGLSRLGKTRTPSGLLDRVIGHWHAGVPT